MKSKLSFVFLVAITSFSVTSSSLAKADETPHEKMVNAYMKGLPSDVVALLKRVESCDHWTGEEPYSKEREDEIVAAVTKLKCDDVDSDKKKLLKKYAKQKNVAKKIRGFPADLN
ncbi:MAG: hypothetical protein U1E10_06335 [Bdellovibrionales bacterium]|jgi:hypothetical protein|nr:hypothetical protein [Bdellovibrionales bacterium]